MPHSHQYIFQNQPISAKRHVEVLIGLHHKVLSLESTNVVSLSISFHFFPMFYKRQIFDFVMPLFIVFLIHFNYRVTLTSDKQNNASPKDAHVLIPRIGCISHYKTKENKATDGIKVADQLSLKRLLWFIQLNPM